MEIIANKLDKYENMATRKHVIFRVPGLGSHCRTADGECRFLEQQFVNIFRCQVMVVDLSFLNPSFADHCGGGIELLANRMATYITTNFTIAEEQFIFSFVTYSLGGLCVRKMLPYLLGYSLYAYISIDCPHRGIFDSSTFKRWFVRKSLRKLGQQLCDETYLRILPQPCEYFKHVVTVAQSDSDRLIPLVSKLPVKNIIGNDLASNDLCDQIGLQGCNIFFVPPKNRLLPSPFGSHNHGINHREWENLFVALFETGIRFE